ncbi:hypothetical protein Arth_0713 [Arthrobacter sp. FB24]|nr:hypothetical protein Arth_0713 [Arthrobacter sp. FB24]
MASAADEAGSKRIEEGLDSSQALRDGRHRFVGGRRQARSPSTGAGYLVIPGGSRRLTPELIQAVSAFQHLVTSDLPVALLVVTRAKAIQSLRREPALGWLSRTEAIYEPAD